MFSIQIVRNKKLSYSEAREKYGDECIMIKASDSLWGGIPQEDESLGTVFDVTYEGHVISSCSNKESRLRKRVEYDLIYEQTERLYNLACKLDGNFVLWNYNGHVWELALCKEGNWYFVSLPISREKAMEMKLK